MHTITDSLDSILRDMDTQIDRMCSKVHKLPSKLLIRIFQEATAQDRDPNRLVLYTNEEDAFAGTVHSVQCLQEVARTHGRLPGHVDLCRRQRRRST